MRGKRKKTIRPLGQIFLDLEVLIDEAIEDHELQWGDLIWWLFGHLRIHRPDAQEEYLDGTHPVLKYGPEEDK